ncbi:MAG: hypothetical protein JW832_06005 [Deltaproteobacteria bacterium]|nr:hypothetical protein [Deltaproteobacteria bacterium]
MWWAPVQRILKWAKIAAPEGPCSGRHRDHVCALAARNDFARIKSVVEKPAFICANCGRVAGLSENLCKPVSIDAIGTGVPPVG